MFLPSTGGQSVLASGQTVESTFYCQNSIVRAGLNALGVFSLVRKPIVLCWLGLSNAPLKDLGASSE
jgi:hypothetical protein